MRIENDTEAAGVAEVVATFASGTQNNSIRSTGGLAKPEAFRAAWAACGKCGLLGPHLATAHGGRSTSVKAAVSAMEASRAARESAAGLSTNYPVMRCRARFRVRGALPLTSSGKLDRRAMRRAREGDPDDHA
jgi:alkylation response protein AidB-like acyl-CoA dehydrogenase